MGGRTDRRSETAADADHQGDEEGIGLITQFLGCLVHDGEEHGTCRRIRNKLSDKRADKANGCHYHYRVGATHIKNAVGQPLGDARFLDGKTEYGTAGKDHENIPVDSLHGLLHVAAAADEHGGGSKESTLQQRHDAEGRDHYHSNHDEGGDDGAVANVGHVTRVEEAEVSLQRRSVEFYVVGTN